MTSTLERNAAPAGTGAGRRRRTAPPAQRTPRRGGAHRRVGPTVSADGHRLDIEGLRAVAVVLVVAFHAGVGFLPGGFVGVDVFYVISGFLITGLLADEAMRSGRISLTRFYARRARRLLPLSAIVLAVTAIASLKILPPLDHATTGDDLRAAALWFANWHFAEASTQYMAATGQSPVLHYWSLSVEEQFYVLWPLILLLVLGRTGLALRSPRVAMRRLVVALACIGGVSLLSSVLLTPSTGSWAYFGLHTRAWELAAGAGLALARPLVPRLPRAVAALGGWFGLGLVLWAAISFGPTTLFPGAAAIVPVGGTVLLLAAGMIRHPGGVSALLARRVPTYIGRISYGWYLWHWPCLIFARQLASDGAVADPEQNVAPSTSPVWLVAAVLVSFLLAAVSAVLVEQPVRRGRWLAALPRRSLTMAAALTAASVFSATALAATTTSFDDSSSVAADAPVADAPPVPSPSGSATTTGSATAPPKPAVAQGRVWPVAKSLRLSPQAARYDEFVADGCYVGFGPVAPRKGCQFGDPNGKFVVALLGDSHAAHWMPAMQRLARERHWQLWFWAKASCPMQKSTVWLEDQNRSYTECDAWRRGIEARLATLPRLDLVVLGRSSSYLHRFIEKGHLLTPSQASSRWEHGSARLFDRLKVVGAERVVQMEDTPLPAKDPPACLSKHPRRIQRCDFPRAGRATPDTSLVAAEGKAAADRPEVRFVSMTDYLCPGDPCPVTSAAGFIVYRDATHLTKTFGESLWKGLGRRIDSALATVPTG